MYQVPLFIKSSRHGMITFFRKTGPLRVKSTGHRWISLTKDRLCCFRRSHPKSTENALKKNCSVASGYIQQMRSNDWHKYHISKIVSHMENELCYWYINYATRYKNTFP